MITVTSEIRRLLKEKDRAIRSGERTMRAVMANLHKQVMGELSGAALTSWDSCYLKKLLGNVEDLMGATQGKARRELSGLLDDMWDRGGSLVDSALKIADLSAGFRIGRASIDALKEYSSSYLEKLFGDAWYGIKGEINLGILGAQTPQQVAAAIGKTLQSGRFKNYANRAETITRTEMGRIYSEATQIRMAEAAQHVEGLEKQWIHAGHPRQPRPSHVAAHGQHVPVDKPFMVGGIAMMYPRGPGVPVSEIIRCGCDHVPYHARWAGEPVITRGGDNTAFPGIHNKAMRRYAEESLEAAPTKVRRIVERFGSACKVRKKARPGSYYDFRKKTISISADSLRDGNGFVFRHEFGHFVDMEGGTQVNAARALSVRGGFSDALRLENQGIRGSLERLERLKGDINSVGGRWHTDQAVSDLFGAVTNNLVVGKYGHWGAYYRARSGWGHQMQAFANLFEIYARNDETVIRYVKQELPDLCAAFEGIIDGL